MNEEEAAVAAAAAPRRGALDSQCVFHESRKWKGKKFNERSFLVGEEGGIPMFMGRKYSVLEEAVECAEGSSGLFLLLLQRDALLPGS